ncbi:MAG: LptF/LptG family permease, partial [Chthoniobacterales bacterium]
MKLLDRFMSRQILVSFGFAVAVLSLVLVVGNILRRLLPLLVNQDLPAHYLITFIAYILPFSLIFTIPWGLLTAVLLVFGRLSADNELIALRANGISITRICVSLGVIAVICTAICLWLNVIAAPAAQQALRHTILDMAQKNPMSLFGSDQVIDQFPGRKIYVGKKEGNQLENIIVFETNEHSLPMRVTFARRGTLEADLPNQRILMHLYGARYQQRDEQNPYDLNRMRDGINMAEGTLPISLQELYEKEKRKPSRSAMS